MNFEFKSTFNRIRTRIGSMIPSAGTTLCMNAVVTALGAWLYFSNTVLPASVASEPLGKYWIILGRAAMQFMVLSTAIAVGSLLYRIVGRKIVRRFAPYLSPVSQIWRYIAGSTRSSVLVALQRSGYLPVKRYAALSIQYFRKNHHQQ
jgi:hypothetical protein